MFSDTWEMRYGRARQAPRLLSNMSAISGCMTSLHEESSDHWPQKEGGNSGERSVSNLRSPATNTWRVQIAGLQRPVIWPCWIKATFWLARARKFAGWGEASATVSSNHRRLHQLDYSSIPAEEAQRRHRVRPGVGQVGCGACWLLARS
jgi:hypothetical protein